MNHSHICASCRRRLAQIRPQKIVQWQPRANFISLSASKPRAPTSTDDHTKEDLLKLGDNVEGKKGRYAAILPERKKRVPLPGRRSPGDELEALFEDALKGPEPVPVRETEFKTLGPKTEPDIPMQNFPQHIPQHVPQPKPHHPLQHAPYHVSQATSQYTSEQASTSLGPYNHIENVKEMLSDPTRMLEAWRYFKEHFDTSTAIEPVKRPLYLSSLASAMRNRLIFAKANEPSDETFPTANEISQVYLRMGFLQGWWWCDMTLILIERILSCRKYPTEDRTHEKKLVEELLGAWNVVCRSSERLQHQRPVGSSLDWSHLPNVSTYDAELSYRKRGVQSFGLLAPVFQSRHLTKLPLVVFATFDILTNESSPVVKEMSAEVFEFKKLLGRFVAISSFNAEQLGLTSEDKFGRSVGPYLEQHFAAIRERAAPMVGEQPPKLDIQSNQKQHTRPHSGHFAIVRKVQDAVARREISKLDFLWRGVVRWPVRQDESEDASGTITPELCNLFMMAFMSIRQPERSIDVWNHMIKCGLTPNLQTWESLISGCKTARNYQSLEELWIKMHALNVQPDGKLWTTRISGLIECKQFDLGIRALDEMGRTWLAAAKLKHPKKKLADLLLLGDIDGTPKPEIGTVNAAISALLFWDKVQPARQILAWASKFDIKPDVITYNTLLKNFVKSGRNKEAMVLLQQMSASGIQADVVTFTTILDVTFQSAKLMTPEQQSELVHATFEGMEQAGVKPNAFTYSKIIFELLQTSSGDLTVVNAVLERMGKQGLEPSPHIFTTLVEHYFRQVPPDIDVIRALILRASAVVGSSDHIFWDRVMEGYARIGETGAALKVLGKIKMTKSNINWATLSTLVAALVQNEELETARSIVRHAAKETGGPIADEVRGSNGQHIFWKNAFALDLVDEDIGTEYNPRVRGVDFHSGKDR